MKWDGLELAGGVQAKAASFWLNTSPQHKGPMMRPVDANLSAVFQPPVLELVIDQCVAVSAGCGSSILGAPF